MALQELPKPAISRREREVAALVADGLTNREIGQRLFVSERTVDAHLEHIREKLGVNSRAQVAAWFVTQTQPVAEVTSPPAIRRRSVSSLTVVASVATIVVLLLGGLVVWVRQQTQAVPSGPIITTVAGSHGANGVTGGNTGDGGLATSAQLASPWGLALGPGGYLYIDDSGVGVIRRVDPSGSISTMAGGQSTPFAEGDYGPQHDIGAVSSVALAPDGSLYFANQAAVVRIASDLSLHSIPTGSMITPSFLCFSPDGTLFISDTFADQVWKRTPDGTLSVYAGDGIHGFAGDNGAATGAKLSYPAGLALDRGGNLFIAEPGNNRIRRVDAATHVITTLAGSSDVYGFSGDGGPADRALLSLPHGVAIASNGDVYIADTGNNRIRRVDAKTHIITTIAGRGRSAFGGDGSPAAIADLFGPFEVAIDAAGDLYVSDTGNHRVRMIRLGANL